MRASTVAYLPHTCTHCSATKALGVSYPYIDYIDAVDVANDLARKELFAPPTCGTLEFQYTQIGAGVPTSTPIDVSGELHPPTFQERHDANVKALAEIHDMVWGDTK